MSTWLAFDAGSPVTSAAVARGARCLVESSGESRSGPSLLHHMDTCLRGSGIALPDLDGIVVLSGPGSFTGIRVALATALGLRAASPVPVFALSNLAALALGADPDGAPDVLAVVDALRDEWFVQAFRRERQGLAQIDAPQRIPVAALAPAAGVVLGVHSLQELPATLARHPAARTYALSAPAAAAASAGELGGLLNANLEALYLRAFTPRQTQVPQRP
jgi:tRNA threonylcarbamoyl adenosine modification protein YeaZ